MFLIALIACACAQTTIPDANQQIAYSKAGTPEETGVWVSTLDGKQRRKIDSLGMLPRWSPDGTRLAYRSSSSFSGGEPHELVVYDFATKKKNAVAKVRGRESLGSYSWSPDGKRIAYATHAKQVRQLFTVDVASRQVQQIALSGGIDCASDPAWSPDGNSLVVVDCTKGQRGLATIEPGGKLIRKLTQPDPGVFDQHPAWSPDGRLITFESTRGDIDKKAPDEPAHTSIFVVNDDGTALRPFVKHKDLSLWFPVWSSDGKLLACEAWKATSRIRGGGVELLTKAAVINVADRQVVVTLGENTGQPALAPMPK